MKLKRIEATNGVITAVVGLESRSVDENLTIYLISDAHVDSIYCAREAWLKHLRQAEQEGAYILDGGDLFDAMQGRFDPRRSMDELRPEYRREDYYDFVVADVANMLKPFAKNILALGSGNHELSVRKNANTDLTERLVAELRRAGSPVVRMGFKGWVRLVFTDKSGHNRGALRIRYSHSGGGAAAPVTRGVIDTNRQAVYLPDADVVWNGHNHHGWIVPIVRERLSDRGIVYTDTVWFVRTPGYKADFGDDLGYAAQKARGPMPIGCVRVRIAVDGDRPVVRTDLLLE